MISEKTNIVSCEFIIVLLQTFAKKKEFTTGFIIWCLLVVEEHVWVGGCKGKIRIFNKEVAFLVPLTKKGTL
jgi:hypothetical protein